MNYEVWQAPRKSPTLIQITAIRKQYQEIIDSSLSKTQAHVCFELSVLWLSMASKREKTQFFPRSAIAIDSHYFTFCVDQ